MPMPFASILFCGVVVVVVVVAFVFDGILFMAPILGRVFYGSLFWVYRGLEFRVLLFGVPLLYGFGI